MGKARKRNFEKRSAAPVAAPAAGAGSASYSAAAPDGSALAGWWNRVRKPVISAFIILNILAVATQLCAPGLLRDRLLDIANPYLWYTGLWQTFCVFTPNPKDYDIYMTAAVTCADGTRVDWLFPEPSRMDYFTRMLHERFRKWAHDNVNADKEKVYWTDAARYIARQFASSSSAPVTVELYRHWTTVPAPGSSEKPQAHTDKFYTYTVKAGDL